MAIRPYDIILQALCLWSNHTSHFKIVAFSAKKTCMHVTKELQTLPVWNAISSTFTFLFGLLVERLHPFRIVSEMCFLFLDTFQIEASAV